MTYAILPLTEDTWQVFTLDLSIDGEAFHAQIEIRYLPAPDQWYLSIWDHAVGEMLVNQIPLVCSYEYLNDLLLPFRHLRDGKGMGSLFCLHPGVRNVGDSHSVPAEHGTINVSPPSSATGGGVRNAPLFRADPAKGNLTEFQMLWGDTFNG